SRRDGSCRTAVSTRPSLNHHHGPTVSMEDILEQKHPAARWLHTSVRRKRVWRKVCKLN
ncbi:Lipoyl synthase, partial [Dissostichus eleginoides]